MGSIIRLARETDAGIDLDQIRRMASDLAQGGAAGGDERTAPAMRNRATAGWPTSRFAAALETLRGSFPIVRRCLIG